MKIYTLKTIGDNILPCLTPFVTQSFIVQELQQVSLTLHVLGENTNKVHIRVFMKLTL